jgi:hypothetical protein
MSAERGFWTIDMDEGVHYWALPAEPNATVNRTNQIPHLHGDSFLAPSARYTARTVVVNGTSELQIFDAANSASPLTTTAGCPIFLGWAKQQERLACVADLTEASGSEVRIFELAASTLLPPTIVRGDYQYSQGEAYARRRAFSAQGNWFAFASTNHLYVATLTGGTPRLGPGEPSRVSGDTARIELAFSPNERWLLEQRAQNLLLHGLNSTASFEPFQINVDPLTPPAQCAEGFWEQPDSWCGNVGTSRALAWSPDSRWGAFLTASGLLQVFEVRLEPSPELSDRFSVNDACGSTCVGRYEFQP